MKEPGLLTDRELSPRFRPNHCALHSRQDALELADLDLLIASTALYHGLVLVTRNLRHFGRVPGLRIYGQTST
jgi:predicted nucleic acid-binding protein